MGWGRRHGSGTPGTAHPVREASKPEGAVLSGPWARAPALFTAICPYAEPRAAASLGLGLSHA